ncbi:MAG: ABC transporter ATP-binding protein [Firmicutes bacterium]|nr:ABC transporter ATP-binding protein [Bacillota bacterium]
MDIFKRLNRFYKPYQYLLGISLVALVFTVGLGLVYPYLLSLIVNKVILAHEFNKLGLYIAIILIASLVKGGFNFTQQYLGQVFGINAAYDLRNTLYKKLNTQSFTYYDGVHTGDLMSRLTADLDAFRQFLAFGFNGLVQFVLLLGFGLGLMFTMNWQLTVAVLVLMPVLAFVAVSFDGKLWPAYKEVRRSLGRLNTAVQENIMGVRTVKSFAREDHELDKFDHRNDSYYTANIITAGLWKKYFPYMELIGNMEVVIVLLFGGYLVVTGHMSLGDLVAFFSVLWYIVAPMSQLGYQLNNWTQSVAAGERLLEILDAPDEITTPVQGYVGEMQGLVEFVHVSLAYADETVLHDIAFSARPGQTIALLGLTGAGKTSLVGLMPRFYDIASGAVKIDGVDVRAWDLAALRKQIAVVFQESFLFSTTIFANIAYGHPSATIEDVRRAAAMADAAEFIEELPDGYSTLVGERGLGLSGGQKQRIALARAILADPRILILDDATSAVDMETEYGIQQALQQVMKGRTTFIIAHRISSLRRADQILVLDHGRIVQRGRHDELLREEGLYRTIYDMQFQDQGLMPPAGEGNLFDSFAESASASASAN